MTHDFKNFDFFFFETAYVFSFKLQLKSSCRDLHRCTLLHSWEHEVHHDQHQVQEPLSMPLQLQSIAETGFFPLKAPMGCLGLTPFLWWLSTAWQPWLCCPKQVTCASKELGSTALPAWLSAPSLSLVCWAGKPSSSPPLGLCKKSIFLSGFQSVF